MMSKTCLECGHIFYGRTDKKFCEDHCRNLHNNRLNSDSTNYIRNINNALRKNRRILEALHQHNVKHTHYQFLAMSGFNFSLHTHCQTKKNVTWFYCYEFGYCVYNADSVAITAVPVKQQKQNALFFSAT